LAVSPDGRWIVSGGTDRIVRVWNAATLNEVAALEGHRGAVQVAFSPNGQTLLSTDGRMVRHWDFNGGQPRLRRSMLGQRGNPFFARETGLIDMGRTFE
jgi:WD40 repeat protein